MCSFGGINACKLEGPFLWKGRSRAESADQPFRVRSCRLSGQVRVRRKRKNFALNFYFTWRHVGMASTNENEERERRGWEFLAFDDAPPSASPSVLYSPSFQIKIFLLIRQSPFLFLKTEGSKERGEK